MPESMEGMSSVYNTLLIPKRTKVLVTENSVKLVPTNYQPGSYESFLFTFSVGLIKDDYYNFFLP